MRPSKMLSVLLATVLLAVVAVVLYTTQPMFPRRAAPPEEASARRLREDVLVLTGMLPRNLADPEKHRAAAEHVRQAWLSYGIPVEMQPYEVDGATVHNVIARFGPESGPRVVVGAHYDAAGHNPGADDNASGTAGLMELGRLLQRHPPEGAVELVAYALEEPPWFGGPQMGSAVHARRLRGEGLRVRGMLSLEMIGTFSDEPGSQSYPIAAMKLVYPARGTFVAVAGRPQEVGLVRRVKRAMAGATELPVRSITAPVSVGQHDLSDNRSYWNEGYRAVMVTDTAFFRNTRYHTAEDTADRLDYVRMAKVVTGVFEATRALARP